MVAWRQPSQQVPDMLAWREPSQLDSRPDHDQLQRLLKLIEARLQLLKPLQLLLNRGESCGDVVFRNVRELFAFSAPFPFLAFATATDSEASAGGPSAALVAYWVGH